jgi:GDSL-like Lipase/Acylhydrolase family
MERTSPLSTTTTAPVAAARHRSTGTALVRALVLIPAVVALAAAAFLTEDVAALWLSRTGHIAEGGYVVALRLASLALGLGMLTLGLLASVRTLQHFLLAFTSMALTFAAIEGTMRLAERLSTAGAAQQPSGLRASTYPGLVYENTPDFVEDGARKFNSLGMRDDERVFDPARQSIVVVGDSIEAWRALPVADMYPRRLESLLNAEADADTVQVINLGVTGYSLHQKLLMLRYRGLEWHPKLIVVGYCLNDPIPAWELINYFTGAPQRRLWRTVEFLDGHVRNLLHNYGVDFYTAVHQPDTESWKGVVDDLQSIGTLAREHHVPVVLVIFPLMVDTSVDYPWRDIHARLREVATANGLQVVDLVDSYQKAGFANVRDDTVHPNGLGHRIAAEQIDAAIRDGRLAFPLTAPQG